MHQKDCELGPSTVRTIVRRVPYANKLDTNNQQDRFTALGELYGKGAGRGCFADATLATWKVPNDQGSDELYMHRVAENKPQKIHFKVFWSRMFCKVGGRATISSAMIVVTS